VPLSSVLREVSHRVAAAEGVPAQASMAQAPMAGVSMGEVLVPDTVPDELTERVDLRAAGLVSASAA
jgi:hypothetical protein